MVYHGKRSVLLQIVWECRNSGNMFKRKILKDCQSHQTGVARIASDLKYKVRIV